MLNGLGGWLAGYQGLRMIRVFGVCNVKARQCLYLMKQ
jgi:hypothetical protein